MGRLFDAVASLLGIRDHADFEGQAAMALEARAASEGTRRYAFALDRTREPWRIDAAPVIRGVASDVAAGVPAGDVAASFHRTVADLIAGVAAGLSRDTGIRQVALTGGVFQNARLLEDAGRALTAAGLTVLIHRQVPCNDGGLSLGQALYAARWLREQA
jgi:hydrogenase maturation protein HypF